MGLKRRGVNTYLAEYQEVRDPRGYVVGWEKCVEERDITYQKARRAFMALGGVQLKDSKEVGLRDLWDGFCLCR